ncbi:MAG: kelch repeat-containing protein [Verrucomicrobia bacterium]|nr:kelch repeat-containing protein [Verrucomicrobiota bacterium]MDA1087498.1 kelch repeat-containing protein [Verrucomicrobiota bacterium]
MLEKRHRHVALRLGGGKVVFAAGFGKNTVEIFDLATERFTATGHQQHFGDLHGIPLARGIGLLVDGGNDSTYTMDAGFVRTANSYSAGPVRWPEMVRLDDGRIFLCGGFDSDFKPLDACVIFDPTTREFNSVGRLETARARHSATLLTSGHILIAGGTGADYTKQSFDSLELFDLRAMKSVAVSMTLKQSRATHAAVRLSDGRVALIGGYAPQLRPSKLASVEIVDLDRESIESGASMGLARGEPVARMLPRGRFAVFGGADDARAIEVYLPALDAFMVAPQLMHAARRSGFTVTEVDDARFLIAGGRPNSTDVVLSDAEFFEESSAAEPDGSEPAVNGDWGKRLGHAEFGVREATTRELIKMGHMARDIVRPLLEHDDPEIRVRAQRVQEAVSVAGGPPDWCVEIWAGGRQVDSLCTTDYKVPGSRGDSNPRTQALSAKMAAHAGARLVVRFPQGLPYATRVGLFNMVGWMDVGNVSLGPPL